MSIKDWNKEHWVTQKEEDIDMIPSGCALCGGKNLYDDEQGWRCKDCGMQINAVSYYQGANAKAQKIRNKKMITKEDILKIVNGVIRNSLNEHPDALINGDWGSFSKRLSGQLYGYLKNDLDSIIDKKLKENSQ